MYKSLKVRHLHPGYDFGGSEVAELTVLNLRPLQLGFAWHPAFPSWVLSDGMGFTRPLVAPLCLPWFKVRKPLEDFYSINLSLWLTRSEEISKEPWQAEVIRGIGAGIWMGVLGGWVISYRDALSFQAAFDHWVGSQIFNWSCKEQNWVQRFIQIVRNWNSRACEAGVAEWLQRFITKTACEKSTKRWWCERRQRTILCAG